MNENNSNNELNKNKEIENNEKKVIDKNEVENEQSEVKTNKKIYLNQICKSLILFFMILIIATGGILLKIHIDENKLVGEVVYLTELSKIRTDIINVKSYEKDGLSRVEDIGEYGGGSYSLDDGKYLNYSIYPDEKIVVQIYNEDNSLMFKKAIKQGNNKEIAINNVYITKDNKFVLSIGYTNKSDEVFSNIITYDKDGKVLSELKIDGITDIEYVDNSSNITIFVYDKNYENKKVVKFDDKNKKVFELNIEGEEIRTFINEDKIIVFKSSSDNKKSDSVSLQIFNEKGKEIFNKENSNFNFDTITNIVQLSDGDFLIEEGQYVNEKDYYGYKLSSIVKVDSKFNEIWRKEINKITYNSNIIELNNEYILVMNEVYNIKDENKQAQVISVTKFDSSGNQKLCKYLGYDKNEEVDIINDGNIDIDGNLYIKNEKVVLKATTFKNNESQGYISLEIDSNGNIS